jgi:hypothetical protein
MPETPETYMPDWAKEFGEANDVKVELSFSGTKVSVTITDKQGHLLGSGGFPVDARHVHRSQFDKRCNNLMMVR